MGYLDKGFVLVIADVLSCITISICFVNKIPQINALMKHKSSRGISLISLCMEVFRFSITWCYSYRYGYPLMQYFEYPALLFQQCLLVYLVLKYDNRLDKWSLIWALGLAATIASFLTGILPRFWLAILIPLCTPIGGFSKIIQVAKIIRTKDSTAVSLTTWLLSSFTSFSRIYTVYVDSADKMLLANSTTSFVTCLSVYLTALYYKKTHSQ